MRTVALAIMLAVAGCGGTQLTPNAQVAQACEVYWRSLGIANGFVLSMTPAQRATVSIATSVALPECNRARHAARTDDQTYDYVAALDRITSALQQLQRVNGQFEGAAE